MTSQVKIFAENGEKVEIPDNDSSGYVNNNSGYGPDYAREIGADPNAKAVERRQMNYLFNTITQNLKQWQDQGIPEWRGVVAGTESKPYSKGAVVNYNGMVYFAHKDVAANILPTNNSHWWPVPTLDTVQKMAPMPAGAGDPSLEVLSVGADFNNLTNGTWEIPVAVAANCQNTPASGIAMMLESKSFGNYVMQRVFSSDGVCYMRVRTNSAWAPWRKQYGENSKPTPLEIGALNRSGDSTTGNFTFGGVKSEMDAGSDIYMSLARKPGVARAGTGIALVQTADDSHTGLATIFGGGFSKWILATSRDTATGELRSTTIHGVGTTKLQVGTSDVYTNAHVVSDGKFYSQTATFHGVSYGQYGITNVKSGAEAEPLLGVSRDSNGDVSFIHSSSPVLRMNHATSLITANRASLGSFLDVGLDTSIGRSLSVGQNIAVQNGRIAAAKTSGDSNAWDKAPLLTQANGPQAGIGFYTPDWSSAGLLKWFAANGNRFECRNADDSNFVPLSFMTMPLGQRDTAGATTAWAFNMLKDHFKWNQMDPNSHVWMLMGPYAVWSHLSSAYVDVGQAYEWTFNWGSAFTGGAYIAIPVVEGSGAGSADYLCAPYVYERGVGFCRVRINEVPNIKDVIQNMKMRIVVIGVRGDYQSIGW